MQGFAADAARSSKRAQDLQTHNGQWEGVRAQAALHRAKAQRHEILGMHLGIIEDAINYYYINSKENVVDIAG